MSGKKPDLLGAFNNAVDRFRDIADRHDSRNEAVCERLVEAANAVFAARDAYAEQNPRSGAVWTGIVFDVQEMKEFLQKNDILVPDQPQQSLNIK